MAFFGQMKQIFGTFQNLDEALLCPVRAEYDRLDNRITHTAKRMKIPMHFFETSNHFQEEKIIICGFHTLPKSKTQNCLIYCHTRNANLEEAENLISYAHERGLGFCAFDFRCHGMSGGKYSSLGFWETTDIATVINFLLKETHFERFVLWGRSMGSVACLNFCSRHHRKTLSERFKIALPHEDRIMFVVLDSPYFSIITCAQNLVRAYSPNVPTFVTDSFLSMFDDDIKQKIGISLEEMNMGFQSYHLKENPYRFIFSLNDELVSLGEQNKIFERVQFWDKKIYKAPGKHNAQRDSAILIDIFNSISVFLQSYEMRQMKKIKSQIELSKVGDIVVEEKRNGVKLLKFHKE